MKPIIRVNHEERKIEMNKEFERRSQNPRSEEYATLQMVRRDYPHYEVGLRTIKKNNNKKTYNGLTYTYMEDYIMINEPEETRAKVMEEYSKMRLIADCHSKAYRYPVIKKWFLAKYPEIAEFGMEKKEDPKEEKVDETKEAAVEVNKVFELKEAAVEEKETEKPMNAEMDDVA